MPISINGTGTITGISAGGLPDACITADDIASGAVTSAKLASGAVGSSGISDGSITYGKLSTSATEADNVAKRTAKAWVNFNGTGTVAIRDDFNVSSITDKGTGDYAVNFSTAMSDANYSVVMSNKPADNNTSTLDVNCPYGITTGSFSMKNSNPAGNTTDSVLNFAVAFGA